MTLPATVLLIWVACGVAFWIFMVLYNSWPEKWSSNGRDPGRAEYLLVWFPICVLTGPLLWIGIAWVHIRMR